MCPQIIQSYSIGFLQCQPLVTEQQRRPTRFRKLSANRPGRQHTKVKYMLTENSSRRQQRVIHKALLGKCRSHCHCCPGKSRCCSVWWLSGGGRCLGGNPLYIMTLAFIQSGQDSNSWLFVQRRRSIIFQC